MNLLPLLAVSAPDIAEFQKILANLNSESCSLKPSVCRWWDPEQFVITSERFQTGWLIWAEKAGLDTYNQVTGILMSVKRKQALASLIGLLYELNPIPMSLHF